MINKNIVIAGIRISFWTNHPADIKCLEDVFLYHLDNNNMPFDAKDWHDVIIMSGLEKLQISTVSPLIWTGHINQNIPVNWYNQTYQEDNIITIADDVLIRHFSKKRLTICYLAEKKTQFFKSHRPLLTNYIFFLLQSVLSMYGKYCLHASCVSKNGQAFLFTGKSGEGKTTISAILGNAGFEYMGDDLVFISQNEKKEITIDAFLTKIKLQRSASKAKDTIDVIKDKHFKYTYQSKLGAIIHLQRTEVGKTSMLIPAKQSESFTWIINSGNNMTIQYRQQLWMNICELASIAPSFTLMFGDKDFFEPAIFDTIMK